MWYAITYNNDDNATNIDDDDNHTVMLVSCLQTKQPGSRSGWGGEVAYYIVCL